jgi:hypothetical protein
LPFHLGCQLPANALPLLRAVDDEKIYESFAAPVTGLSDGADAGADRRRVLNGHEADVWLPCHDSGKRACAPIERKFLFTETADVAQLMRG